MSSHPACPLPLTGLIALWVAAALPVSVHAVTAAPKGGTTPDISTTVSVPPYPSAGTSLAVTTTYTNTPTAGTEAVYDVVLSQPWTFIQSSCGDFAQQAPGHARAVFGIAAGESITCETRFWIPETFQGAVTIDAQAVSFADPATGNNADQATATVVRLRVNTTQDRVDHAPGDGACREAAEGLPVCALRAAILEANALPGQQLIELPWTASPYLLTRQGIDTDHWGDLDITDAVTVRGIANTSGERPVVATGFSTEVHRVFDVAAPDHTVMLQEVRLAGAEAPVAGGGGVLRHAAGILNLRGVDVTGGAATTAGGGIHLAAPALMRFVSVRENSAATGGGIAAEFAPGEWLQFIDGELRDNSGQGDNSLGGGLYVAGGEVELQRALLAFNAADRGGGAMFLTADAQVENTTVTNNTADVSGGGLSVSFGTLDLRWSTVADNAAAPGDDSSGLGGGIHLDSLSTAAVQSTVFSGNTAQVRLAGTGLIQLPYPHSAACDGVITSLGHNAVQPVTSDQACTWNGSDGDQLDVHAGIGPLADNGGYTMTRALLPDAAEIDTGYPGCPSAMGTVTQDQRSIGRPIDGDGNGFAQCDKGAFEFVPAAVITVIKQGSGDGVITSNPVGIHCGETCSAEFAAGTAVTLLPSQAAGSVFAGWVSPCTGTGQCVVTAQPGEIEVIASFSKPLQGVTVFADGFE